MATSLNNMIDESKLYPGYEFLVTVDRNSENVVLVTGFIGSIKYRGALLRYAANVPPNTIRACVCDNVFNSDFSSKNSFSLANMAITNYYSHKKYKRNNIAMFSVNKRAKENYICANCKMKISYFTKRESKSPPPELSKKINNNNNGNNNNKNNSASKNINITYKNSINNNTNSGNNNISKNAVNNSNLKSDIAVLKQTLSYPDISDDILPRNIDHSKPLFLSNCLELNSKSLKRKREHTNHIMVEKKSKISISSQNQDMRISFNKIEEITENRTSLSETIEQNLAQEKKDKLVLESSGEDKQGEIKREETKRKETEDELKFIEHINEQVTETEEQMETPQNYEEYRSMPLSLSTLNHINSSDNDKTSDDSLNRECPKPKKIWMKMIENEDIQKLIDSPPSSERPDTAVSVGIKPQPLVHNKITHSNRSYKIKQTLHDKVILTVDKRLERHKPESHSEAISDIYTFSDESEMVPNAQNSIVNDESLSKLINNVDINPLVDTKKDDSNQSSNSSSDSKKSQSSKISRKTILNDVSKSDMKNSSNTNHIGKLTIKMEPESEMDVNLFKQNNLVSTISTCENSTGIAFNLNDIVWAKITGYPFWPAKIISFSQEEDVFIGCIEWYAWNEISFIKVNNLYHFNTYFSTKYQKRNRNGKYQEAVKLAKYDCGMLDIPGSKTTSDDNENTSSIKGSDTDSESNPASYTSASL